MERRHPDSVVVNGTAQKTWSLGSGAFGVDTYTATDGDEMGIPMDIGNLGWQKISFTITDPGGGTVYSGGAPGAGPFAVDLFNDPSCGVVGCVASLPQTESLRHWFVTCKLVDKPNHRDGWRFTGTPGYNAYNNGRPNTPWIDFQVPMQE